jgi:plastocyanin
VTRWGTSLGYRDNLAVDVRIPVAAMMVMALAGPTGVLPVRASDTTVAVEDNRFAPREVAVVVGDEVTWTRAPGSVEPHNVREDERLFSSGPVTEGPIAFAAAFSAGSFHYFCEAHGSRAGGMDGVVRVAPSVEAGPAGRRFTVRWATNETSTGSRFDVQYRRGGGRWREWKDDARALRGVFGKRGRPERVRNGARYRFRARSGRGEAESRWSPVASFVP